MKNTQITALKPMAILDEQSIQNKIYTLRGMQVMLDRDLAELYAVKAIRLREQIRRNIKRFPDDFMFKLNESEVDLMVSQNAIPSKQHLGGAFPLAFTEQGIANISGILTSDIAIDINLKIMRTFVKMRHFIAQNSDIFKRLDFIEKRQIGFEIKSDEKFNKIFDAIESKDIKPKQGIFYDGQIFDAYVFVADLIKTAKSSIILIDNYVDESTLILLSKRDASCKATIYTKTRTKQLELDLKKHNAQYSPIEIKEFDLSHDRFLILDETEIYHIGASLKDLGKKWFGFSKMDSQSFEMMGKLK